jgi:hypothetical protein
VAFALQIVTRSHAILFFILCHILLFYYKINTCASYVSSWLGYAPLQIVMTGMRARARPPCAMSSSPPTPMILCSTVSMDPIKLHTCSEQPDLDKAPLGALDCTICRAFSSNIPFADSDGRQQRLLLHADGQGQRRTMFAGALAVFALPASAVTPSSAMSRQHATLMPAITSLVATVSDSEL